MGLTSLPVEQDYSLGRDKVQQGPEYDLDHAVTADEHNLIKRSTGEMVQAIGLEDGTTPGSLEMMKRAVNDPAGARPDAFVYIDDFRNLNGWEDLSSGGTLEIADGNNSVSQTAGSSLLRMGVSASDIIEIRDETSYLNGTHDVIIHARVRLPSDLDHAQFYFGLAENNDPYPNSWVFIGNSSGATEGWFVSAKSLDGGSTEMQSGLGEALPDTWYDITIVIVNGTEIRFYVDDILLYIITDVDAIPNDLDALGRLFYLTTNTGTDEVYVDYYDLRGTRL